MGRFLTDDEAQGVRISARAYVGQLLPLVRERDPRKRHEVASIVALAVQGATKAIEDAGGDRSDTILGLARACAPLLLQTGDPVYVRDFLQHLDEELIGVAASLEVARRGGRVDA